MAGDGMMRASDAEREAVVSVLRDAYTAGRLTLEEFDERTSAAYAGRTWGELRELTSDLPEKTLLEQPPARPGPPPVPPVPVSRPPAAPRRRQRPGGALLPFVAVWFVIVLATRSGVETAAPVVVLVLVLLFAVMSRRK